MGSLKTYSAIATTIVLWSSAFPGIKAALLEYCPGHLLLLRFMIASAVLGIVAFIIRMPLPRLWDIPGIFALGAVGIAIYQAGLTFGQQTVSSGAAALIVALTPLFVALFAVVFLREQLSLSGLGGAATGFFGIALITLGEPGQLSFGGGVPLILVATVATSLYFVFQKPFLKRYSPLQVTSWSIWAGTAILFVFSPGILDSVSHASAAATATVIYLALFPGLAAYLTRTYALARAPASILGNAIYLEPPVAMIVAFLWLGEWPTAHSVIGGVITLAGVLIVSHRGRPMPVVDG